jgi:hypothetical protein
MTFVPLPVDHPNGSEPSEEVSRSSLRVYVLPLVVVP